MSKPEKSKVLTEEQKEVAEKNIGLLYKFVGSLCSDIPDRDRDDLFGHLSLTYLRAIQLHETDKSDGSKLSTYLFVALFRSKSSFMRKQHSFFKTGGICFSSDENSSTLNSATSRNKSQVEINHEKFEDQVLPHLGVLDGRDREIFEAYYLTSDVTVQDVGDQFGISKQRTSQILKRCLYELKREATNALQGTQSKVEQL